MSQPTKEKGGKGKEGDEINGPVGRKKSQVLFADYWVLRYRLALSHNQLSSLPARFAECVSLRYLNIRGNQIKEFPLPVRHPTYPFVLSHQCMVQSNIAISFASSNPSKSSISAVTSCEFCRQTLRSSPPSRFSRSRRTRFESCPSAWRKWLRSKSSNLKGTLSAFPHGMRCKYRLQAPPTRGLEERAR